MHDPFAGSSEPFKSEPYDPEKDREKVRGRITFATTIVFGVVLVIYLGAAFWATGERWTNKKDAMSSVLPAVTSVLGTVVGFYFGSQKR
jgi:hypothetical protein